MYQTDDSEWRVVFTRDHNVGREDKKIEVTCFQPQGTKSIYRVIIVWQWHGYVLEFPVLHVRNEQVHL